MSVFTRAGKPYGGGMFAGVGALEPAPLKARLVNYRRNVAKRYRVVAPDWVASVIPNDDLFISTKVDGELWFLVKLRGEVALCTATGRVLEGIPLCVEAERLLSPVGDIVVAGELFAVRKEGRTRVQDVGRALSESDAAPTLGFKAFDLLSEGEEDTQKRPYGERLARLNTLFGEGRRVGVVLTEQGHNPDVSTRYEDWVRSGKFEGLVVRADQSIFKVKPSLTIDAVVLGFGEHRAGDVHDVRELVVGLLREDGGYQVLGAVANGLAAADKVAWFQRLEPMVVESQYRMANSEGTLCRWVRPEIVVELRCSDLLDTDTQDAPVRRMVLTYGDSGWATREVRPFVSLVFPVFVRERADKTVDPIYVGLEQVTAVVALDTEAEVRGGRAVGPRAEAVARRVWTKLGKTGTAVRKVVLIETHRPSEFGPPFVVFFTDWSAGRKEPLVTSLRVASTLTHAQAAMDQWIVENIKSGWNEVV